jgi:iron(III) transport system ATP-binding protein
MTKVLTLSDVRRLYHGKAAVDGVSLTLQSGRISCLLGPSGCGKSTLLRLIAGLEPVDGGAIESAQGKLSAPGLHVPPERRDIGFVFQDYALFPHLTVEANVAFGLQRTAAAERRRLAHQALTHVGLDHRAASYPQALSGGEQQRVALARAMVRKPALLLLDEPFSGLDGRLKTEVRDATLAALREAGAAALIVTHDAEEAMMMADDLALMKHGRILQTGSPRDCYLKPVSASAARLLGETNLLPARIEGGEAVTAFGSIPAASGATVMARPEAFVLGDEGVIATVVEARYAGATCVLTLKVGDSLAQARTPLGRAPEPGAQVKVTLDPGLCTVFD